MNLLGIYEYCVLLKELLLKVQPSGLWKFFVASLFLALSRICQTAAFFLPLKILILISSEGVPHYLDMLQGFVSFEYLIYIFVAAVPMCFGGYVFFGVVYRFFIDRELRLSSPKMLLLGGGKKVEKKGVAKLHSHLSKVISEVFVVIISLSILVILAPLIVAFIALSIFFNLWWFNRVVLHRSESTRFGVLGLHGRQVIEYISSLNFLAMLIALVVYMMVFGMGVYLAIFTLIFSRMVFQSVQRMAIELMFVNRHLGLDKKVKLANE